MKIALDSQMYLVPQKTGIPWYVKRLTVSALKQNIKNDFRFDYFTQSVPGSEIENFEREFMQYGKLNRCRIKKLRWGVYRMSWGILPITYESLFGKGADVVHFFNYIYPPKIKAKIITTIYDTSYIDAPETLRRRTKHLLDKNLARSCEMADKVIVISEYTKARIIELLNVDPNKIEIIYPGVDNNLYNTNTGADEQKIVKERYGIAGEYYLYLGTIEPRKNIVRLVEAYADLYQKRKDCPKLVLAGSLGWLYNPILDTINSSVAKEKILLTGYIEDKDVPALISGANAFVFPSIYEGFGMPPLEAMACGVPVIASGTTALKEVISGVGLEVNPYSVEEIENALERIVADTELRKTSVEKGIKKALEFTWEKSASKLLGVYDSI